MATEGEPLREILTAYKALEGLLREEQGAIVEGRMEDLEPLLANGIEMISAIEERREGFLATEARPEVDGVREEIDQVLKGLLRLSHRNEELMGERWRKVGKEIERIKAGQELLRAYWPAQRNSRISVKKR